MPTNWKEYLKIVYVLAARHSHDPSTQLAALLVSEDGKIKMADVNRFPDGVYETAERWERPLKYKFIEHAERNVLYSASKKGIKTDGLTMVASGGACSDCARAIIQSGIRKVVIHKQARIRENERWREEVEIVFCMFKEAGVEVVVYDGKIGAMEVLDNGQLWSP